MTAEEYLYSTQIGSIYHQIKEYTLRRIEPKVTRADITGISECY